MYKEDLPRRVASLELTARRIEEAAWSLQLGHFVNLSFCNVGHNRISATCLAACGNARANAAQRSWASVE